jgi:periplasmic protein TonB
MATYTMNAMNTVNDQFKEQYPKYLRNALVLALILTILYFLFSPEVVITPYSRQSSELVMTDIPEAIDLPPPPQDVPKQVKQIEAVPDDEALDDEDIADTLMDMDEVMDFGNEYSGDDYGSFEVSQDKPKLIKFQRPDYPEMARASQLEGTVVVKIQVGTDGSVLQAQVIQAVHPLLDKAAVEAARRCRFVPGKQRGIPVKAWMAIPFVFSLHTS